MVVIFNSFFGVFLVCNTNVHVWLGVCFIPLLYTMVNINMHEGRFISVKTFVQILHAIYVGINKNYIS